jgi:hypothetical protein
MTKPTLFFFTDNGIYWKLFLLIYNTVICMPAGSKESSLLCTE